LFSMLRIPTGATSGAPPQPHRRPQSIPIGTQTRHRSLQDSHDTAWPCRTHQHLTYQIQARHQVQ
jgi:hypothetical protein